MSHGTHTYPTLDGALADIANRSFYESARITKHDDGTNISYTVEDWHIDIEETCMWTYENGVELDHYSNIIDYSRLHESYESYTEARHIRYILNDAVIEMIESERSVGFTYVVADTYCEDDNREECYEDHTAGWLLVATDETTN